MNEDVVKIKESVLSKGNDKELIEVDKFLLLFKKLHNITQYSKY